MTDHDDVQHRSQFQASGDAIEVRQPEGEGDGDGRFRIRMPVSSTAEARDGEAFGRDRLRGFADQIADGDVGVFLDHGRSGPGDSRYSALSKVGYWAEPEVTDRDAGADLVADAVLMDPAELDADVGDLREALATLKAQAELGVPLASSVGWSESTGDRDVPGGADLLEISIVGIPSDPRTTTADAGEPALARAVSAASTDFDVATFVRELTAGERNVVEVGGEEVDLTPPDAVQNAATVALAKDDDLEPDCGTGAGRTSARQIAGDDVTAERIDDIAAYLTSHEEDVSADGPPSDWSDEEWSDCGNLQYAKWGGTGTGTGLAWAQETANAVAEAQGEDLPYPNRDMTRNLDDPEFSEGDAVVWSSQDTPVHGRIAGVHEQFSPNEDVTITGDEGEAVYSIYEWDDSLSPPRFQNSPSDPNVAKPQSSLNASQRDLPPATAENFEGDENSMTDETDASDEQSEATTDAQRASMEEMMAEMVEMQEEQIRMLEEMMGGDENAGDGEMDDEEEDDMDEESADADNAERTVTLDGEERAVDEALAALREQADEAEPAEPETRDFAEADEDDEESERSDTSDQTGGFGFAAAEE
ncbi:MAG: hypothetical protein V5A13_04445 [Haloarculaceae archaeon]